MLHSKVFSSVHLSYLSVIVTLLCLFVFTYEEQKSAWLSNQGWSLLARGIVFNKQEYISAALDILQNNPAHPNRAERDNAGLAIAQILSDNVSAPTPFWKDNIDIQQRLIAVGEWHAARERWDQALLFIGDGINLSMDSSDPLLDHLGKVCQDTYFRDDLNLKSSSHLLCQTYFAHNNNNLALDGQFRQGDLHFWSHHATQGSNYEVDFQIGQPSPSVKIETQTEQYHGGIYQAIVLPPGIQIDIRSEIRIESSKAMRIFPLYIRWWEKGEEKVSAMQPVEGDMDWKQFSRTFQTRIVDNNEYFIYPAFVRGVGEVWIDNVEFHFKHP